MSTELPKIDFENFEPMNRVQEGRNAFVNCRALGTFPMITNWYRGGKPVVVEKQRGNMLKITDATMYDTGRYSCTVKNPAGEVTADTYVQIRKYILYYNLMLNSFELSVGQRKILVPGKNRTKEHPVYQAHALSRI